jgi:hypothetical protein
MCPGFNLHLSKEGVHFADLQNGIALSSNNSLAEIGLLGMRVGSVRMGFANAYKGAALLTILRASVDLIHYLITQGTAPSTS